MTKVLLPLLLVALTVWCLVSLLQAPAGAVRNLPRWAWALLVLVLPLAGGIAYVLAGRPLGTADGRGPGGGPGSGPRRPAPRGPDDDEDFLRGL